MGEPFQGSNDYFGDLIPRLSVPSNLGLKLANAFGVIFWAEILKYVRGRLLEGFGNPKIHLPAQRFHSRDCQFGVICLVEYERDRGDVGARLPITVNSKKTPPTNVGVSAESRSTV